MPHVLAHPNTAPPAPATGDAPVDAYFSADVETDGPIPGEYSMLSFALVFAGTFDGVTYPTKSDGQDVSSGAQAHKPEVSSRGASGKWLGPQATAPFGHAARGSYARSGAVGDRARRKRK